MNIQQDPSFETTSEATKIGLWDWEVSSDAVVFSSEWKRQLGYADEEIGVHIDEWASRVHPEDLPMARERLADYLAQRLPKYEVEFRMRHKDGSWLWILSKAGIIRYEAGRAVQMLGCHIDITRHKQAACQLEQLNKALKESQQKLEEAQRIAHLGALGTQS